MSFYLPKIVSSLWKMDIRIGYSAFQWEHLSNLAIDMSEISQCIETAA
jgi:hypothetical protein